MHERERERGSSLISYFPALACPHKQLSPPSQVKTEVHRDPDYQEPAELIGKQTQSYQNPFVSWVCKWAILWAYEILAKKDSLNLKLASHFNCLTTFTSGPQIFFPQLRHDSL